MNLSIPTLPPMPHSNPILLFSYFGKALLQESQRLKRNQLALGDPLSTAGFLVPGPFGTNVRTS